MKFLIAHRIREMHSATGQTGTVLNALSLTSQRTLVRTGALNLAAQLFPRCTVFPPSLKFDRVAIYFCTLSSVFHFLPFSLPFSLFFSLLFPSNLTRRVSDIFSFFFPLLIAQRRTLSLNALLSSYHSRKLCRSSSSPCRQFLSTLFYHPFNLLPHLNLAVDPTLKLPFAC